MPTTEILSFVYIYSISEEIKYKIVIAVISVNWFTQSSKSIINSWVC